MKAMLLAQAARIDRLSLRERALMFASLAVALVAAADMLVLSPRLAERKALVAQMQQRSSEMATLRAARAAPEEAHDDSPRGRLLKRLAETRQHVVEADATIARLQAEAPEGALEAMLDRGLARREGLALVRLAAAPPAAPASAVLLPRRSVELVLRGSYHDLTRYVADTETQLPALRWGDLTIRQHDGQTELEAQVFVPGASR